MRVEKNRGVFVRQVSLEEASEFYEVRAALEGLIGRLAARRIAMEEIEQLRSVVKRMHQVQKSRKTDEYFALNVEFHDILVRAARNNALMANYRKHFENQGLSDPDAVVAGDGADAEGLVPAIRQYCLGSALAGHPVHLRESIRAEVTDDGRRMGAGEFLQSVFVVPP